MELELGTNNEYILRMGVYEKEMLATILHGNAASHAAVMGLSESDRINLMKQQYEALGLPEDIDYAELDAERVKQYRFCNDWLSELNSGFTTIDLGVNHEAFDDAEKKIERGININFVSEEIKTNKDYKRLTEDVVDEVIKSCVIKAMEKRNSNVIVNKFVCDTLVYVIKDAKEEKLEIYVSREWERRIHKYKLEKSE